MIRVGSSGPFPSQLRGAVIALGNFDGFHSGHQAVVAAGADLARAHGRPLVVATFAPHPVRYFRPALPPFMLTDLDQRETLFARAGGDAMLVFEFNAMMARLSAQEFIESLLLDRFGVAGIVTGSGFRFGRLRQGDADVLRQVGRQHGLAITIVDHVERDGLPVSSSRIRAALAQGRCEETATMLTRPFALRGYAEAGPDGTVLLMDIGSYVGLAPGDYAVRCRTAGAATAPATARVIPTPDGQQIAVWLEPGHRIDLSEAIEVDLLTRSEQGRSPAQRLMTPA